ncbi:MAG TPA: PLDc N-terminal domain-containing protein [Nocardioides sp.]|nr:PLDc N-terminal domain-containing protein [Nocardioides sp.]
MSFWDVIWFIIISYLFIAYLILMFNIIRDVFRDQEMSGVAKAVWLVAMIFFPLVTAVIYLIARGKGMAKRDYQARQQAQTQQDEYIRSVASTTSPSAEIAQAKSLLDSGVLTQAEFEAIKQKAMA